jgi:ribosomal protein L7/L12
MNNEVGKKSQQLFGQRGYYIVELTAIDAARKADVIEEVQLFDVSLEDAEELVNEVEAGRRCPIGRLVHEDDADAAAIQLEDAGAEVRLIPAWTYVDVELH